MMQPVTRLRQMTAAQVRRMQQVGSDLLVGPGMLYECARLLHDQGVRCVMVVTSPGFVKRGVIASFTQDLLNHGIATAVFSEVSSAPDLECVAKAAAFYRSHSCEAMVALGGGSTIDCAKAAGALIARPKKSVRDLVGEGKVGKAAPYLIAVPTTAGTGSEATPTAMIVDPGQGRMLAIRDAALVPDVAILDANLLVQLSPDMTACSGMDALTHAVEAYINRYGSRAARDSAEEAVALVFKHLQDACANGSSIKHRENMLMASYYAGLACANAQVGYVHALSHALGVRYGVQHGLTNSVLLPLVLREYGKAAERRLARLGEVIGLGGKQDHVLAARFVERICELSTSLGLPAGLPQIQQEDIPLLAEQAAAEGNPAYPVPEIWKAPRFQAVLQEAAALEGASSQASVQGDLKPAAVTVPTEQEPLARGGAPALKRQRGKRIAITGAITAVAAVATAAFVLVRKK